MQNVVRHPLLYFDDGNIVLSALPTADSELSRTTNLNNTAGSSDPSIPNTLLFRVHKSLLSENSVVFRDMFELGEGSSDISEKYGGVSMVQMPDSAEEVRDILKYFYEPWAVQLQKYHPDTCLLVKNVLAVATKYQFARVRQNIVTHIKHDWPKTLDEWDRFEDYLIWLNLQRKSECSYWPEPAATAILAMRYNIPSVLPAVFYCLSKTNTSDNWVEPKVIGPWELAEIVRRNPFIRDWTSGRACIRRQARWDLLDAGHLQNLLKGRDLIERFIQEEAESISNLLWTCQSAACSEGRKKILGYIHEAGHFRDPLDTLRIEDKAWQSMPGPCYNCKPELKKRMEEIRTKIWEKLPVFFKISRFLASPS